MDSVQPVVSGDGYVLLPRSDALGLQRSVELPDSVTAPVPEGGKLGEIVLSSGSQQLARVPLTASCGVERLSAPGVMLRLINLLFCAS